MTEAAPVKPSKRGAWFRGTLNYDFLRKDHQRQLNKLNDVIVETATTVQGLQFVLADAEDRLAAGNKTIAVTVPNKRLKRVPLRRNLDRHIALVKEQINQRAHVQALVFSITIVEDYLSSNLVRLLRADPRRLLTSAKGNKLKEDQGLPLDLREVLAAGSLEAIVCAKANQRVREAMYAAPSAYLTYFQAVTGVALSEGLWLAFVEVKATRDLYVHADGRINDVYLGKVGDQARGSSSDVATVDAQYFEKSVSCLKGLLSEVYVGLRALYCDTEPLHALFLAEQA